MFPVSNSNISISIPALLYIHPSITSTWRPLTNSAVAVNTEPLDSDCAISASTAVPKMVTIVWYATSRSLVEIYQNFGEACRLPLYFKVSHPTTISTLLQISKFLKTDIHKKKTQRFSAEDTGPRVRYDY